MKRMNWNERLAFVDWRNPQYQGPFSCLGENGRHLTWIPCYGIFESIDVPLHVLRETFPAWDRVAVYGEGR